VRLFIQDGRKQNLTVSLGTQDYRPTVSPDGRSAAFLRQERDRRLVCRIALADRRESCSEWKAKANSIAWYGIPATCCSAIRKACGRCGCKLMVMAAYPHACRKAPLSISPPTALCGASRSRATIPT